MTDPGFDNELAQIQEFMQRLLREAGELHERIRRLEQGREQEQPVPHTPPPLSEPEAQARDVRPLPSATLLQPAVPPTPQKPPTAPLTAWVKSETLRPPQSEPAAQAMDKNLVPEPPAAGVAAGDTEPGKPTGQAELVIGKIWLNRVGAFILLLAVIFFVKYSFDQGWISPTLRVIAGAIVGLGLLGAGEYCLWRGMRSFAPGVLGCGVGILYVAVFGAYNLYELVGTNTAAVLYIGVTAMSVAVSVHANLLPVAILAVIGGYSTPIALSTGVNAQVSLLTYVLFLDAGFLVCASMRRWDILRPLVWLATLGLFGGWYIEFYEPSAMWQTWGFLLTFYVLFHGEAILSVRRRWMTWPRLTATVIHADNVVFFAATYFLLRAEVPGSWLGVYAVIMTGVQWLAAWLGAGEVSEPEAQARDDKTWQSPRLALWLNGAAMLALAAPLAFDRYLVSLSWSVQAVVTFGFCRRFDSIWLRIKGTGVLAAAIVHLFVFEYHDAELTNTLAQLGHWTLAWTTLLFVSAGLCCYAGAALLLARQQPDARDTELAVWLLAIGSGLLLWLFADQWERYLASWWWLGLAAAWWIVAWRVPVAALGAVPLTILACVKFLFWDTWAATQNVWADLDGILFNRAVLTGVLVAGLAAYSRLQVERLPGAIKKRLGPVNVISVIAALVITWTGTFEIARVFRFEEWASQRYAVRAPMRDILITAFWALNALAMWLVAGRRRRTCGDYALVLTSVVIVKLMAIDTLASAASGRSSWLGGIASNPTFIVGLVVIAVSLCGFWKARYLVTAGPSSLFQPQTLTIGVVVIALLITWMPTYEIARVFQFEQWAHRLFGRPLLARGIFITAFWALNAAGMWLIAGSKRRVQADYALILTGLVMFKMMAVDTVRYAQTGHWEHLSGLCTNRTFLVGLLVIGLGLLCYRKTMRLIKSAPSPLFQPQTLMAALLTVTLLITWIPTFEIARAFRFEPFASRFEDASLAMHVALSVFWGLNATVALMLGFAHRIALLRFMGLGLYCATVVKVFLFDLSHVEAVYRIISFVVLGASLIFGSLLYQRLWSRITDSPAPVPAIAPPPE